MIVKFRLHDSWKKVCAGKILLVANQDDCLTVWIEKNELVDHVQTLRIYATGEEPKGEHVGSAVVGCYVWHVYKD